MMGLLDQLDMDGCIVAGHSMGGFVAQQMAVTAASCVRALILICTAPKADIKAAEAQIRIGQAIYGLAPKAAVEKLLESYFANPEKLRATPGAMELLLEDQLQIQALENSHGYAKLAAVRFNIEAKLEEIKVPTLVIHCADDTTFPPNGGNITNHTSGMLLFE